MSSPPDDDDPIDSSDDFLREVAHVDDRVPPAPSSRPVLTGSVIDHYRIREPIARGGMGVVFLAEDEKLRRRVALKLLPPSFAADPDRRRRLFREARATAAVSHPNLVTIYDVGEHEGRAYLVMEYLEGASLRRVIAGRLLEVEEVVAIARQLLDGLAHAHAAGLLHRDLKPENVVVTAEGRAKILDFGLVKMDDEDREASPSASWTAQGASLTRDGHVVGTPGYMSPEQARGQPVDARTDVFAFGVVLYEMFTRTRPFDGPTRADAMSSLLRDTPTPVDELRPEVGPEMASVVLRCLAKSTDERFSTAVSLREALLAADRARRERIASVSSMPSSGTRNALLANVQGDDAHEAGTQRRRWRIVLGTVVAAASSALVVVALRVPKPAGPTDAMADAAPRPRPTAITDMPPPPTTSAEAKVAYAHAMQAIRDADWGVAKERLLEAVGRDPSMSAAFLRLAIVNQEKEGTVDSREALSRAMQSRANLSERDQALLFAIEPVINRVPSERSVSRERLREMLEKYPYDAELWHLFGMFGSMNETEGLEAERHAVEIDPQFADAWQILGEHLAQVGNMEDALAALERCIAIAPLSADCRGARAGLYARIGECAKMEEDLRRGLSSNPRAAPGWHDERAAALFALGRPDDAVLEAMRRKWVLYKPDRRAQVEPLDRAMLAASRGDFAQAEAHLRTGEQAIEFDLNGQIHASYAALRLAVLTEIGKVDDAAKVADGYLRKKDLWLMQSPSDELEISMQRALVRAGKVTPEAFAAQRDRWILRAKPSMMSDDPIVPWLQAFASDLATPEEARDALTRLPAFSKAQLGTRPFVSSQLGATYVLANRPVDAVPYLETAIAACNALHWPIHWMRAKLNLGRAEEALGERERACRTYRDVLASWPASSRSITREKASGRVAALACAVDGG